MKAPGEPTARRSARPPGRLSARPSAHLASRPAPRRPPRFGLRSRVTAAFAAGAALLSGALAAGTYGLVHHYLLDQREGSATNQTYTDASLLSRDISDPGANVGQALASLVGSQGTTLLLYQRGEWYSASAAVGQGGHRSRPSLPPSLITMVHKGTPARQRILDDGQPAVVIGVPLASEGADYFEVHSLSELSNTLDLLATVLIACAVATTLGGLLVGRWASGRLVRPLRTIADVAAAIAGGALDQRLPSADDPDLGSLATSFNEMVGALEERIRRDARFASDVSHELRSPLTTIEATVGLLEASESSLPPGSRKALELLSGEIRRFSVMVQDLLEISRFDAGADNLDLEELPVADLVVNTVETYSQGSVPVSVSAEAEGTWLMGDRRRLQRVLVNLLDNARAYAGGATGVKVDRHFDQALVTVEDAGPGVPQAERRAIFERFYRGSAAGRRGAGSGTGLGLALVAEHVKAHHGRVEVADRPGGGSRFILCLPLARPEPADGTPGDGAPGLTAGVDGS